MIVDGECEDWTGYTRPDGYGRRSVRGVLQFAHRVAYEQVHGPIPDGATVDHLCFNPACVNPAHMRLMTALENARNQRSAHKTHCDSGHEYTPENTYLRPHSYRQGTRDCRTCIRERAARYKARKRAS